MVDIQNSVTGGMTDALVLRREVPRLDARAPEIGANQQDSSSILPQAHAAPRSHQLTTSRPQPKE